MKITPILTSILMNAFAVVGFISVLFVLFMKVVLDEQPKLSCFNDRVFDFVSSHYVNGEKLELIRYNSGVSDDMNIFVLYNRKDRINGCIQYGKQIAMEVLDTGVEKTEKTGFPDKIVVHKDAIKISYADGPRTNVNEVPVVWDIKSKLASVQ